MGEVGGPIGVVTGLVRTSFLVNAVYAQSSREHGLTPQQGQLLCVLMARPYGMGALGTVLGLAKSSITGLVDRSERNGLVRRVPDPQDTRAVRVALTAHGRKVAEEFYAETCRRIERLPVGFTAEDRHALAELLGRIVTANEVPVVFLEQDEETPAARGR
jgi:DNA-binding MarR family transcriptional regulator